MHDFPAGSHGSPPGHARLRSYAKHAALKQFLLLKRSLFAFQRILMCACHPPGKAIRGTIFSAGSKMAFMLVFSVISLHPLRNDRFIRHGHKTGNWRSLGKP
ncbi:hypothetical protein THS27_08650 [Thalassospira sp. MCCC 1A01428]|nr:hypothetical protein THS27_08650 [Thalassospira sp. MCCC 1A01428]